MSERVIPAAVDADSLARMIDGSSAARVLDVRTPGEYESAHIRGSYNVPLNQLGEHAAEIRKNVDEPVVLVCQSGARAKKAEEVLAEAGMPNLSVLEGGMNGWIAAGKPVASAGRQRISLERQVRIAAGSLAFIGGALALTVSPYFAALSAFVGAGLVFAGVTNTCGMAMVLAKLPYNRSASCDVRQMVRSLKEGAEPPVQTAEK
jgi:rhodanese-related sulfurtransferase